MKKFISILLAMIIAMASVSVFAEATVMEGEFSIRNGIKFGMSIEEVCAIETTTLCDVKTKNSVTMGKTTMYGYQASSIAGIPCSGKSPTLRYYFNSEGKLEAIHYWYGYYSHNSAWSYYHEMYDLMCEKYGEPLHHSDGEFFDILTPAFDTYFASNGYMKISGYAEWLVEYDDIWVVMDVLLNDMKTKSGDYEFSVGYRCISKEKMAAIVSNAERAAADKKQEQNSDI